MKWLNKNVVVTGAGGFIGSHLVESLITKGANVTAFLHYNSNNSRGWLEELTEEQQKNVNFVFGDLVSKESVANAIRGKDIVFHLGALISVPYSYINPRSYIQTNIEGTLNILTICKEYGIERIIHTSTSEVYGNPKEVPIDETHPLQAQSSYAASKIAADKFAESFYLTYNLPITIVRPFNTFGPRQSARAVIPTIITQMLLSDYIKIGSTTPCRDFNYVQDTVDGFIIAAESNKLQGETVNLGSGIAYSVGDIINMLIDITGKKVEIVTDHERIRPSKSEVKILLANSDKMKKLTNWRTKIDIKVGLQETLEWIKSKISIYKSHLYNI